MMELPEGRNYAINYGGTWVIARSWESMTDVMAPANEQRLVAFAFVEGGKLCYSFSHLRPNPPAGCVQEAMTLTEALNKAEELRKAGYKYVRVGVIVTVQGDFIYG